MRANLLALLKRNRSGTNESESVTSSSKRFNTRLKSCSRKTENGARKRRRLQISPRTLYPDVIESVSIE
jgi:hypothetical protein